MKALLLAFKSILIAAATAHGQGTVLFQNRIAGVVDAPVYYRDRNSPADGNFVAQLYASPPGGTLAPVGAPIPFRNTPEAAKGYWVGETRTIPGVPENGAAQVMVVAWRLSFGTTYEEAVEKGLGEFGNSVILPSVVTGGGLNPPTALLGLSGFTIVQAIPEPSIAALGLLGAGILLIRPRR